jgi:hypothetical protein
LVFKNANIQQENGENRPKSDHNIDPRGSIFLGDNKIKGISWISPLGNYLTTTKKTRLQVKGIQGDQIRRIFAYWVLVYFGQFYAKIPQQSNFWSTFFPR